MDFTLFFKDTQLLWQSFLRRIPANMWDKYDRKTLF